MNEKLDFEIPQPLINTLVIGAGSYLLAKLGGSILNGEEVNMFSPIQTLNPESGIGLFFKALGSSGVFASTVMSIQSIKKYTSSILRSNY